MQKELNPELFGEAGQKSRVFEAPAQNNHVHVLEQKILETRNQVHHLAEGLNKIVSQINEFIKSSQVKFERMQQALNKLEQNDQALSVDATQKISALHTRLGERKSMDYKIQEMIDRHNSVLRSHEVRMAQLQKLVSEKEAQVLAAQSALNETKMEIARLKRL
jgi:chromosome segregation ATPase